jgi:hypothetical protein
VPIGVGNGDTKYAVTILCGPSGGRWPTPLLCDSGASSTVVQIANSVAGHASSAYVGSCQVPLAGSKPVVSAKDLGCALADDDARGHGIAGRHPGHDRPIGDAKVFYPNSFRLPSTTDIASWPISAVQVWCHKHADIGIFSEPPRHQ